jgi:uncharacterized membrane protein YuzA (DUF378 family)
MGRWWAIDAPSLLLIMVGGFYLGLLGVFGFDAIDWAIGEGYKKAAFSIIGLATVWQFFRQRWV